MHDEVKIPVVRKTSVITKTSSKQNRQKETVHKLSDVTVPANRCMIVLAYVKLPPADYIVRNNRMTNRLFIADRLITGKDKASETINEYSKIHLFIIHFS